MFHSLLFYPDRKKNARVKSPFCFSSEFTLCRLNASTVIPCCLLLLLLGMHQVCAQSLAMTRFSVNGSGVSPAIAVGSTGDFMMISTQVRWDLWNDTVINGSIQPPPLHLNGRVFHSDGSAKGDEFNIFKGSGITGNRTVCSDADGNFTCFWRTTRSTRTDIYRGSYDALGNALGSRSRVVEPFKDLNASYQLLTFDADLAPDGSFVVIWSASVRIHDGRSFIFGQRFNPQGEKIGDKFLVTAAEPAAHQSESMVSVSMDQDGGFVIAWLHRFFPEFPAAETSIALKAATFDPEGNHLETHVVFHREELPEGHEHSAPRVDKVAGKGFVVMTNHSIRKDIPEDAPNPHEEYTSIFEGRFYPEQGEPTDLVSLPGFDVHGKAGFDLVLNEAGKIAMTFDGYKPTQRYSHFVTYNRDFTIASDYQILTPEGTIPTPAEIGPVIASREDGSLVYAVTQLTANPQTSRNTPVFGGIIHTTSNPQESKGLHIKNLDDVTIEIEFESQEGTTYRLNRGQSPDKMEIIETIEGSGEKIQRQFPKEQSMEFFSVKEGA